jgi:serine/threonine protein kinase
MTNEGRVKVLDFGLARIHEGGLADGLYTKEGATLGTTPYMPPEQAKGKSIDARADIFSVGATMFRLITGRYLHDATGAFDLLMKQAREPAPPIARFVPDLPRAVSLIIDRALAFDREQRYPDAQTMLEDVRAAMRGRTPPYAARLADGTDRAATTQVGGPPAISAMAETKGDSGGEIPIYLSGFSEVFDPTSTDREPAPQVKPEPGAAPKITVNGEVEVTLASPGNDPNKPNAG